MLCDGHALAEKLYPFLINVNVRVFWNCSVEKKRGGGRMKELEPGYNLFDTSKDCLIIVSMNGLEYLYMTNENTYICIRSNE